jgi:hypothetical protein
VIVVAAGVHHADLLPVVGRPHLRGKRQVHLFGDGQGIHVGSKRNHFARLAPAQNTHDAGVRDAGAHLDPESSQMIGHDLRRAGFAIPELRMFVKVTTPAKHLLEHLLCAAIDLRGH